MPPEVIERVKLHHPRFQNSMADEIVRTRFALADAQLVIAREHGFESWPKFGSISKLGRVRPWLLR